MDTKRKKMWISSGILSFVMSALWLVLLTLFVSDMPRAYQTTLDIFKNSPVIKTLMDATNLVNILVIFSVISIVMNIVIGNLYLKISRFESTKFTLYKGKLGGILVLHFLFGGFVVPILLGFSTIYSVKRMRKHANNEIEKNLPFDIEKLSLQIQQVKKAYFVGDIATKDEYMRQINFILDSYSK